MGYKNSRIFFMAGGYIILLTGALMLLLISECASAHQFGKAGIDHYVRFIPGREYLIVEHDMHFGELPSIAVASSIDLDRNGKLNYDELREYVEVLTSLYQQRLKVEIIYGGKTTTPVLTWPDGGYAENCNARTVTGEGRKTIRINWILKADWPDDFGKLNTDRVKIKFRRDEPRRPTLASWLYVTGDSDAGFELLESNIPTDKKFPMPPDITDPQADKKDVPVMVESKIVFGLASDLRGSDWTPDTGMDVAMNETMPGEDIAETTSGNSVSGSGEWGDGFKNRIMGLLEPPVSRATKLLVIALCFVWGAMHAFSPGHGKAIAGTYLMSARASYRHAALLGILVTITHTSVVLILAVAAYYLKDRFVYPMWLQPLGAVIILLVGVRQIVTGIRKALGHGHYHTHVADIHADEAQGKDCHPVSSSVEIKDIVGVGVSGGMVPCPASIVLLLFSWQLAMPGLGLIAIISFSLGLALTLVAVGFMAVSGTKLIVRWMSGKDGGHHHHASIESIVPVIGGVVLLVLGFIILSGYSG